MARKTSLAKNATDHVIGEATKEKKKKCSALFIHLAIYDA